MKAYRNNPFLMERIISQRQAGEFTVISNVDDDEMTDDQKKQRDAKLANSAVKVMAKMELHLKIK